MPAPPHPEQAATKLTATYHREEAARFSWYHCVDLGSGVVTDGEYDMASIISHYDFPDRMEGTTVLDVGRASGYFSFEFERRGARVTAADIASFFDWDFVGGDKVRELRRAQVSDPDGFTSKHISGAFRFAKQVLGSSVEEKTINVYELDPDRFDGRKFDIVFAGSVTSHLRDPALAFERLYSVTKGKCIIAAPSFDIRPVADCPLMMLIGTADPDCRSWWIFNARGLTDLLRCAGFSSVKIVSSFKLRSRRSSQAVEHIVAHAEP